MIHSPFSSTVSYLSNSTEEDIVPPQSPLSKHILSLKDKLKLVPLELWLAEALFITKVPIGNHNIGYSVYLKVEFSNPTSKNIFLFIENKLSASLIAAYESSFK